MKHVSPLTKISMLPATAGSDLYVKEVWVDFFAGIVSLFSDFVSLIEDIRDLQE